MFGVYKIENKITKEVYVGQTIRDFETRWKEHTYELNSKKHNNKHLQNAWNKYGGESFKFTIEHIADELDNLNELEKYYINKYDCFNRGYNLTLGGDGFIYDENINAQRIESAKRLSEYSIRQIENVKKLLCEETHLSIGNRNKQISKITGVSEGSVENIRYGNSWTWVLSELNDKIYDSTKNINSIFDKMYNMLYEDGSTIKDISIKLNLSENQIKYYFKKNNIKFSDKNKENIYNEQEKIIMKSYAEGYILSKDLKKQTGFSYYIIRRVLDKNNISLQENSIKTRFNKEKNCLEKGISWDIATQTWLLRVMLNGKQVAIGRFNTLKQAKDVKNEVNKLLSTNDLDSISKIKEKYRREITKKVIVATNIDTKEHEIIEGIGVAARKLNIKRRYIENVLKGKQKTTCGYVFEYAI